MEVDETDREDFKLDSEEEVIEKKDDHPKKNARVGNPVLGKRKRHARKAIKVLEVKLRARQTVMARSRGRSQRRVKLRSGMR